MIQTKSRILLNKELAEDCWSLTLNAPQIAPEARPGQFVNLRIRDGNEPLLRRPFSIFRCTKPDVGNFSISIIYRVIGKGTGLMAALKQGDEIDIIGPLGHGFERRQDKKIHVLLGGGMGSSGLFMLGEDISKAVSQGACELYILLGAKAKRSLILEGEFQALNGEVLVSTDDGTFGYHGSAIEMLKECIDWEKIGSDCAIYACGPELMLKELAEFSEHYHVPAQVSLERHMICGFGACLNCVCKVNKKSVLKYRDLKSSHMQFIPDEEFGYALACKDGPVFNIDEVEFDE